MPWVPFDDKYPSHRKVAGLSDAAFRLHTTAFFWCRDNGTNGVISRGDLPLVVPRLRSALRYANECTNREVWHDARHDCPSTNCPAPVDVDGWVMHDYLWLHPTKTEAETALANASAAKSQGAKLGNHRKWHLGGRTSPDCPYCPQAIAMRSDSESVSDQIASRGSDRLRVAGRSPYPDPDPDPRSGVPVDPSSTGCNARTDDDDLILKTIIDTISECTGRSIDAEWAAKIASLILAGRRPKDPAAYCRKAIRNDPDPATRFALPSSTRPAWCGQCDEQSRMRPSQIKPDAVTPCQACHPLKVRTAS